MTSFPRDAHNAQMCAVKAKIKNAGPIHKKDLMRQLRRMEKELQIYDKYRKGR